MNKAHRTALIWFLHTMDIERTDAEELLDVLAKGIAKQEADSVTIFTKMIEKAEARATADSDAEDVLKLLQLGHQLAAAQDFLGRTKTMIAMRQIIDLPKGSTMAQRVRSMKLNELKAKLG
jgi:hypothetical protein